MDLRSIQPNLQTPEQIDRALQDLQKQREDARVRTRIAPPEYVEITAYVTRVTQMGTKGGDAVFTVKAPKSGLSFTCVCSYFCPVQENDSIYAICIEERDPYHGKILRIARPPFVQCPQDQESTIRVFVRVLRGTGFGDIKARKLYAALESQSSRDLGKSDPLGELTELSSLWTETHDEDIFVPYMHIVTTEQLKKLACWWHKNRSLRRLWLLGLTNKEIEACKMPADLIYEKCLNNPYPLVGLSLEKCDEVLLRQNKIGTDLDRRCGQVVRAVYDFMNNKAWTGTPSNVISRMFPDIPTLMDHLKKEFGVVGELRTVYLEYAYKVEHSVAKKIDALIRMNPPLDLPVDSAPVETVNFISRTLTDEQKRAVQGALDNWVSIITGFAGSGKTSILSEIVHNLELRNETYALLSFTGKAVSRIREVVKRKSPSTIHRLIARASSMPKFKHIIIDETSMVTAELLYLLFKAFPYEFKITFIGDLHQLQTIGWGELFGQMIASGKVPIFKLTKVLRVEITPGVQNGILINANAIIECSEDPDIPFEFTPTTNFNIIEGDVEKVYDVIRGLFQSGVDVNDVTIITPYNREIDQLNATAQQIFNEASRHVIDNRGRQWSIKDRVIMLQNNYTINVMNGETGVIVDISPEEIQVRFSDGGIHVFQLEKKPDPTKAKNYKPVKSTSPDAEEEDKGKDPELTVESLALAYCLSCHRAQGSEWPYVIVYVPASTANTNFLNRNLIYTAITRAKRACWMIIPDTNSMIAAAVRAAPYRCDNLSTRIVNYALLPAPAPSVDEKMRQSEQILISKKLMSDLSEVTID